jgi:putative membrane protein insertion efficiency factor
MTTPCRSEQPPPSTGEERPPNTTSSSRALKLTFTLYKRLLSPLIHSLTHLLGGHSQCRYLPTCSEYAYTAIARHGWPRGSVLALTRLARCHPWSRGGLDPVPPTPSSNF